MKWLMITVVLIALATMIFLLLQGSRTTQEAATNERSAPNTENDKVVLVKGWREEELHKIIADFIETYKNESYPAYTIEFQKQGENFYRLTFSKDIHPLLFTFLINYLAYPFDFDFKNRSIIVGGKTTLSSAFAGIDQSLVGQKALLYIPENDQDHDIVYMQTESGINLANSFTELVWRRVKDARLTREAKKLIEGA